MGDVGPVFLVGLRREAALLGAGARVVIGEAALAAALADGAGGVVSFGLCGALDPTLAVGDMVLGVSVASARGAYWADWPWTERLANALPWARRGGFAGVEAPAASRADKAALREATGAIAVDMESQVAAALATRSGVPFAIARAVSDDASRDLPAAALAGFGPDGRVNLAAVLAGLALRPWEIGALTRVGRDAEAAFAALARWAPAIRASAP